MAARGEEAMARKPSRGGRAACGELSGGVLVCGARVGVSLGSRGGSRGGWFDWGWFGWRRIVSVSAIAGSVCGRRFNSRWVSLR